MPGSPNPNAANTFPAAQGRDALEPATMVEDMASAIGRVRRMATTLFEGDAALFVDTAAEPLA